MNGIQINKYSNEEEEERRRQTDRKKVQEKMKQKSRQYLFNS